jgi:hypothetical protein
MTDRLERELHSLGADRPISEALFTRLESALLEDAAARRAASEGDPAAGLFEGLDAPRPLPPTTRAALERELTSDVDRRPARILLAVAAAVLLVVGSVAALRAGGSSTNQDVAAGPPRTVPEPGVPPLLQAPTPTTQVAPVLTPAEPAAPPTPKRRPTTTTTWDCGLCARSGAAAAPAGHPGPSGSGAAAVALTPPYVSSVDPSSGPRTGGTVVTVGGAGFTGADNVFFGSTPALNFTVVSDTEIRAMSPPSPEAQTVTVSVTFPGGNATQPTGGSSFAYTA